MATFIIYPNEISVSIIVSTGELPIEDVAKKDVPAGLPYLFIEDTELPNIETHPEWIVDFSNPDGYGMGYEAWAEEKRQNEVQL